MIPVARGYPPGMTNEREQEQTQEPTEAAKALHGDKAAVETNEQPDAIVLDSGTRIARPAPADDDNE